MEVYLLPAVVGGGLGDIEEVLAAGRRLARAGYPILLYRPANDPMPRAVAGPWAWPPVRRVSVLRPNARSAITVTPAFGVSAAPERPGAFGRAGPWARAVADLEATYGPERTLHVSLEEFARTLSVRRESSERFREGGVRARGIPARVAAARASGDEARFRSAFRTFRAFDRPNVLHLFATFAPDASFAREMPEAVQVGPLWSGRFNRARPRPPRVRPRWVWYASPASAERIAPAVVEGLRRSGRPVRLEVRSPRPWRWTLPPEVGTFSTEPVAARSWDRSFADADLRIVTGSRTLLEALEVGGPFLYFNGVLGAGAARRRHRPEKLTALLAAARRSGVPRELRRDLADFGRGRRVAEIVERAAARRGAWARFPRRFLHPEFPPSRRDLGRLLLTIARELDRSDRSAPEIVRAVRREPLGGD